MRMLRCWARTVVIWFVRVDRVRMAASEQWNLPESEVVFLVNLTVDCATSNALPTGAPSKSYPALGQSNGPG